MSSEVKLSDTVMVPPEVMARQVGNEVVILDLASGTYFGLDPVGGRIWQLLAEGRSVNDICATMQSEYDAAPDVLMQDLLSLLETLSSKGLVQLQPRRDGTSD